MCETLSMVANIGVSQPDYVLVNRRASGGGGGSWDGMKEGGLSVVAEGEGEMVGEGGGGEEKPLVGKDAEASSSASAEGPASAESARAREGRAAAAVEEASKVGEGGGSSGEEPGKAEKSASEELLQPTIQALAVLSNVRTLHSMPLKGCFVSHVFSCFKVLAHFIDCVFGGSEKDKVTSLLRAVLFNVWPHLHSFR